MNMGHDVDERKRILRPTATNKQGTKSIQNGNGAAEKDLCNKFTSLFCHEPNRKVVFNDKPEVGRN